MCTGISSPASRTIISYSEFTFTTLRNIHYIQPYIHYLAMYIDLQLLISEIKSFRNFKGQLEKYIESTTIVLFCFFHLLST